MLECVFIEGFDVACERGCAGTVACELLWIVSREWSFQLSAYCKEYSARTIILHCIQKGYMRYHTSRVVCSATWQDLLADLETGFGPVMSITPFCWMKWVKASEEGWIRYNLIRQSTDQPMAAVAPCQYEDLLRARLIGF